MPQKSYSERARDRLERFERNLEEFRRTREPHDPTLRVERNALIRGLRQMQLSTRNRLSAFAASGPTPLKDLRGGTESAFREMGTIVQRFLETAEPALAGERAERRRYLLGPDERGGWQLKRVRADQATRRFRSKAEALDFSRRYVKGKQPSELMVRRRDGTFETRHRYG